MKAKTILITAFLTVICTSASAQQLRLHVADKSLQKRTSVNYSPQYDYIGNKHIAPEFDSKGDFSFDANMPGQFNWVNIYSGRNSKNVIIEKGKTADVTITKDKDGKAIFKVKGGNKAGSDYINHLSSGTSTTPITGYGMPEDRVPAKEGLRQLDSTMVVLRKELKKIKPEALRDFLTRLTDATEIHYKLELLSDHRDTHVYCNFGQPEYNEVAKNIKPNDPVYLRFRLNDRYVRQQMSDDDMDNDDLTGYGLKFIAKMKEAGIDNSLVKSVMLDRLANFVLFSSHPNDVDPFWKALTDYADDDTALNNKYGAQVASLRATKQGNPAIDETFSDSAGVSHSFAEYKGKVLYVDLWATWCVPCQKEIPHFAKVAAHYKDNPKVQLISISMDKEEAYGKWLDQIRREKPQWPQFKLSKAEHDKMSADYGVKFIPRFILIDADGNLVNADAERPSDPKIYGIIDNLLGEGFSISGKFPGLVDGAKVEVQLASNRETKTIAEGVVKDGAFKLQGHLDKPTVCTIKIDDRIPMGNRDYPKNRGISFMASNAPMTINAASFDSIPRIYELGTVPMTHEKNVKVSGGKFQDEYQEWRNAVYAKDLAHELAGNKLWRYRFGSDNPGKANYDKAHEKMLQDKEQAALEAYEKANADFAKSHPNYAISLYLQSQKLDNYFRFTNEELDAMLALYKNNGDTAGYSDFKEKAKAYRKYARNVHYTNFAVQTPDGKETSIKSYLKAGKYNIIDFWASWCGPCRASIPLVKQMHKDNPNVNIISVSCDTKLDDWKKAMEEEQMPWTQLVLSPDKAKVKVARDAYKIQFIPYLLIIDPNGKVTYAANSAEEIISKLKK